MLQHFVTIHFNSWDQNQDGRNLNPDWIDYRMQLMCNFTLPSLAQQTSNDFSTRIFCDARSRQTVENAFKKYTSRRKPKLLFVFNNDEDTESRQLRPDATKVLDTRIDSDDMFREDAIHLIKNNSKDCEVIIPPNGYLYNSPTLRHFHWPSPPYYTFCTDPETWNNKDLYYKWWKLDREVASHMEIRDKFTSSIIEERIFCTLAHGSNTMSQNSPGVGKAIWWPPKKRSILKRFGIT